jgi:phosphomannomutase
MDADRLAVVSEHGEPIGEDYTLVLAAWHILSKLGAARTGSDPMSGPVVVANLATTMALDDLGARFGSRVVRSKIGEANVTACMKIEKAVIGGEGNGGVIYPRINFARDSQVGMALILHLLAASGRSLSSLMTELPRYAMVKEKLACPSGKIPEVLRAISADYAHLPIDARDGIKVTLADGWFLVRGSNTEPIVRVVAEARSETAVRQIVDDVFGRVARIVGV